jgi:N-acetylglutamate synthase/N-acetylornithine aminotransferase
LTGKHTPHVTEVFESLRVDLPASSIDTEVIVGTGVSGGGLIDLAELRAAFEVLESELEEMVKSI